MKNKNIIKILIPVLMLCVIAGIWVSQILPQQKLEENVPSSKSDFPLEITSVDLEALSKHKLPIIIDFGADECVPCKQMAPVLVKLNEDMQGKAIIQFVDVWKNPNASIGFPVQLIPTQVFVNSDGTPYVPSKELSSTIQFSMYTDRETNKHTFTVHQGGLTEEQMLLILADMGVKL